MPDDELMQAGTAPVSLGRGLRWRLPCVGAPFYEWINGICVVMYDDELPSTA